MISPMRTRLHLTRRRFLGLAAASAASAAALRRPWATRDAGKAREGRTVLSFYCDDTGPYTAGAKAFRTFLDFCAENGIAGESSLILGANGHSMSRGPNDEERAYLEQVARAWECGVDTHMELMTHAGLFDFETDREMKDAVHEGLWLHEPEVRAEQYERYFESVIAEGERSGVRFTGLTWPGCGCAACGKRYAELSAKGSAEPNPAVWKALLSLAKKGRFRGRAVPCFFGSSETDFGLRQKAADGPVAVYDLIPNVLDRFGIWENSPAQVDADHYITADGRSGILVRHIEAGTPYCLWYSHWQGLNPETGVGWRAFVTVVERIRRHLRDRIVWLRPSDIAGRFHDAGGWSFVDGLET